MKPFIVNSDRRLVSPFNFLPEPNFSSIDPREDVAGIVRRNHEVKAPTGSEIRTRPAYRQRSLFQSCWRCSGMKLARPVFVPLLTCAVIVWAAVAVAATNGTAGRRQQESATPAAPRDPTAVEASLGLDRPTRRLIQRGLRNEGVDPGPADGLFGPRTRVAIRDWQRRRGAAPTGYLNGAEAERLQAAAVPRLAVPDAPPPEEAPATDETDATALSAAASRLVGPEADPDARPAPVATDGVGPDSGSPAVRGGRDLLQPVPFLESTDLFWAPRYDPGFRYRIRTENRLEANIFPHFIIGFPSRCRGESSAWLSPCISATMGVRLRAAWDGSAPIRSPSILPRANVQWLFYGEETTRAVTLQLGHHSNGQSGCLWLWSGFSGEEAGQCADDAPGEELGRPLVTEPNTTDGNFWLNYFRFFFDEADHDFLGIAAARLSVGVEWNPRGWMYGPVGAQYPSWRYHLALGAGFQDVGFCERLDFFVGGWRGSEVTGGGQATCVWNEERGLGAFVRPYFGADEYNSAYFGQSAGRLEVGLTINRIGTFGRDY